MNTRITSIGDTIRVSLYLPAKNWRHLERLNPARDARQNTIRTLIEQLINELTKIGITDYNPADFDRAIGRLVVTIPNINDPGRIGGTGDVNGNAGESDKGHVGQRIGSVSCATSPTSVKPTSSDGTPQRTKRSRGEKTK